LQIVDIRLIPRLQDKFLNTDTCLSNIHVVYRAFKPRFGDFVLTL